MPIVEKIHYRNFYRKRSVAARKIALISSSYLNHVLVSMTLAFFQQKILS